MRSRHFSRLGLSAALSLALLGVGAPAAQAAVSLSDIDNSTEVGVRLGYNKFFKPLLKVKTNWSGNLKNCQAGYTNIEARVASIKAVNYARKLAGLQPVKEAKLVTKRGQATALMMKAAEDLSHNPTPGWPCYSESGAEGARTSNLYWSSIDHTAAYWILGYLDDYGSNNTQVAHRSWVLNPKTSLMGVGITSNTSALVITGDGISSLNPDKPEGVAWPSAGYFPADLIPTSNRWSYNMSGLQDMGVNVSVTKNGVELGNQPIEFIGHAGGSGTTLVWQMPKVETPKISSVDVYQITITGTSPAISPYEVKVIPTSLPAMKATLKANIVAERLNGNTQNLARVGKTITAKAETVDPKTDKVQPYPDGIKLTYKWYRDDKPIPGAYGPTRKLVGADAGKFISVKITASADGYSDAVDTSAGVLVAQGVFYDGQVTMSGTAKVGNTLYAKKSSFSPEPSFYSYQWYRNEMPIKGANKAQYVLKAEDKNKRIKVKITAHRAGFQTLTKAAKSKLVLKAD